MRIFLKTLAFSVATLFANVCALLPTMLAYNKTCSSAGNALAIYAVIEVLLSITAPILFWRFNANVDNLMRVILTVGIGVLQIVAALILTSGLMLAFNC
jgi:hypothetical protein